MDMDRPMSANLVDQLNQVSPGVRRLYEQSGLDQMRVRIEQGVDGQSEPATAHANDTIQRLREETDSLVADNRRRPGSTERPVTDRNATAGSAQDKDKAGLIESWLKSMRDKREERREERLRRREAKDGDGPKPPAANNAPTTVKVGSVEKMTLPKDFAEAKADPESESLWGVDVHVYRLTGQPNTKIVYARHEAYGVDPDSVKQLNDVLAKAPLGKEIPAKDQDRFVQAIPLGLEGTNGPFTVTSMRVEQVGGRRSLVMDISYDRTDRRRTFVMANADAKNRTLDMLWFEAPSRQYKEHAKDAMKAIYTLEWKKP